MIAPGKQVCGACGGAGYVHPAPPPHSWLMCRTCDGIGAAWKPGGPRFGAPMDLAERNPGEVVELATGGRGRILWHVPRKRRGVRPEITFVALIDDFDDHEAEHPIAFHSSIGVVSVATKTGAANGVELHDGEKDADLVDPFARRSREVAGELL